jgi:hypothetical protein
MRLCKIDHKRQSAGTAAHQTHVLWVFSRGRAAVSAMGNVLVEAERVNALLSRCSAPGSAVMPRFNA